MRGKFHGWAVAGVCVLALCVAGCGSGRVDASSRPARVLTGVAASRALSALPLAQRAKVEALGRRLERELHRSGGPAPAYRPRGRIGYVGTPPRTAETQVEPSVAQLVRDVSQRRGALRASFEVQLRGGMALTPAGAPHGSGRVRVSFYGTSTICWRFTQLTGVQRPDQVQLSRVTAVRAGHRSIVPLMPLGAYRWSGCAQDVTKRGFARMERRPGGLLFGVGDAGDELAIGGVL